VQVYKNVVLFLEQLKCELRNVYWRSFFFK